MKTLRQMLEERREQVARRLGAAKAALVEVEKSLRICATADAKAKELISGIRRQVLVPHFPTRYEYLLCNDDMTREREQVEALEELVRDLPKIRAYWNKRREELAA